MKYLHTMIRVFDLDKNLDFFKKLGLIQVDRKDFESGKFSLIFLATAPNEPTVELTYNWDQKEAYSQGRNFGHIAYEVDNIYETCERLMNEGIVINRPPRDGYMAFIRTPENISVELLQKGSPLPTSEPWASMPNVGEW